MVDQHGLAGSRTGLGKRLAARQHVDEGRLAHVATPYKGILGQTRVGALAVITVADLKFGGFDVHIVVAFLIVIDSLQVE